MLVKAILGTLAALFFYLTVATPSHFSRRKDSDASAYQAAITITSLFWLCVLGLSHV